MSRASRPPSRMRLVAAAGLALPMSQVGHAAAYLERYGTLGLQLEREHVHAYFPQLLQSSAEVLGLLLLAVPVVLAAGRMALGPRVGIPQTATRVPVGEDPARIPSRPQDP